MEVLLFPESVLLLFLLESQRSKDFLTEVDAEKSSHENVHGRFQGNLQREQPVNWVPARGNWCGGAPVGAGCRDWERDREIETEGNRDTETGRRGSKKGDRETQKKVRRET